MIGTRHIITFQGGTVEEARRSFEATIDAYLASCLESGEEPDRPFSGRFNVRVPEATHRGLAEAAEARRISLNDAAILAFDAYIATHRDPASIPPASPPGATRLKRRGRAEYKAGA